MQQESNQTKEFNLACKNSNMQRDTCQAFLSRDLAMREWKTRVFVGSRVR